MQYFFLLQYPPGSIYSHHVYNGGTITNETLNGRKNYCVKLENLLVAHSPLLARDSHGLAHLPGLFLVELVHIQISLSEQKSVHVGVGALAEEKAGSVGQLVSNTAITSSAKKQAVHVGMSSLAEEKTGSVRKLFI
jgi:hypothetical protein